MKSRKFEKLLKIISIITIIIIVASIIMGWIYNKKIENASKNGIEINENENVSNGSDDVFK